MQEGNNQADWLNLDGEELLFFGNLGGFETAIAGEEDAERTVGVDEIASSGVDAEEILKALSLVASKEGPDEFVRFVAENKEKIHRAAMLNQDIVQALLIGYKLGIGQKNGACANDLGAMYYMGDLVEQDYNKAAELYDMAIRWGCSQSIINMGYIYEYGRIGRPDYAKAYEYYSLAAALTQKSEALYKLGDMYSRGKSVAKDMARAVQLWDRSFQLADGPRELAQPAIRLAPLHLEGLEEASISPDPMYALHLYQVAEIGLRLDIKDGLTYYEKRLCQAMEGQEKARFALDEREFFLE